MLEKSNKLVCTDKYLSNLEESTSFFISVQQAVQTEHISNETITQPYHTLYIKSWARLEFSWTQTKIQYEQRLCRTYMEQFDTTMQMVIFENILKPTSSNKIRRSYRTALLKAPPYSIEVVGPPSNSPRPAWSIDSESCDCKHQLYQTPRAGYLSTRHTQRCNGIPHNVAGNAAAHNGNAVTDATFYKGGQRSGVTLMVKLYGRTCARAANGGM